LAPLLDEEVSGCATTANKRAQVLSVISGAVTDPLNSALCRHICYERVSQERSPESFAINWIAAKLLLRVIRYEAGSATAVHNQYRTETSLKYTSKHCRAVAAAAAAAEYYAFASQFTGETHTHHHRAVRHIPSRIQ